MDLIASTTRLLGGTGSFDLEKPRKKPRRQWLGAHDGHSNAKTVPAYSMRLAGPKGLGRSMDSAGLSLVMLKLIDSPDVLFAATGSRYFLLALECTNSVGMAV